jgi:hypothetical protein
MRLSAECVGLISAREPVVSKRYLVKWKELRMFKCSSEVEAPTPEQAKMLAQNYEYDVEEVELYTEKAFPATAELIEDEEE